MVLDENWYLHAYPSIRKAIETGRFRSGEHHFRRHGRDEGRSGSPPLSPGPRVFAHGAYGTNNVGDEAIFEGLKRRFPECIQIYINQPRVPGSVMVYHMLAGPNRFRADDHLIIGGGGLLYDRPALQVMVDLAARMRAAGGQVDVLGIGCESAKPAYYDLIKQLVGHARDVTVRTTTSQQILQDIAGVSCRRQDDFALNLPAPALGPVGDDRLAPRIGVVTTGDPREDISVLAGIVHRHTGPDAPNGRVHFVHIPHSRASRHNNDVTVGHTLWSSIEIYKRNRDLFFHLEPFSPDPATVLRTYATLDGVITARFHGMVFAHLTGLPVLSMRAHTLKNQSFIKDYPRDGFFTSSSANELPAAFHAFITHVRARRATRRDPAGSAAAPDNEAA